MSTREQYEHDAAEFHRLSVELARLRFNFLSSFGQTRAVDHSQARRNGSRLCRDGTADSQPYREGRLP